jgi:ClpX C4-type zinc finger protein
LKAYSRLWGDEGINVVEATTTSPEVACSFCGKSQPDVLQLIAGADYASRGAASECSCPGRGAASLDGAPQSRDPWRLIWTPDQQRITPLARRAAQHPGNARCRHANNPLPGTWLSSSLVPSGSSNRIEYPGAHWSSRGAPTIFAPSVCRKPCSSSTSARSRARKQR